MVVSNVFFGSPLFGEDFQFDLRIFFRWVVQPPNHPKQHQNITTTTKTHGKPEKWKQKNPQIYGNKNPPGDSSRDLALSPSWMSRFALERVTFSPSQKGHQQNCQAQKKIKNVRSIINSDSLDRKTSVVVFFRQVLLLWLLCFSILT